ncbi:MAG TPA: hypothetical protein VFP93_00990, partial [Gammaproteobacteria bacterium]|nr:hypothetical protein [Gammaproteobacteria bacterium]
KLSTMQIRYIRVLLTRSIVMQKFHRWGKLFFICSLFLSSTQVWSAPPTEIIFSNFTDLSLNTSIAGLPGNGIDPMISKPVSYGIVTIGCNFAQALTNCPIEFRDRANGNHVATVRINAIEASLVEPPIFYGEYANRYKVTGWETVPIKEITIQKI